MTCKNSEGQAKAAKIFLFFPHNAQIRSTAAIMGPAAANRGIFSA
jgi:hypothetical protein